MSRAIVEIFELMNYVGGGSRPFEEGCNILNSNHILLCGAYNTSNTKINKYFALCLKTSFISSCPHEINVEIQIVDNKKIIKVHCSCQAGNSGRCKHSVGVLLLLNKHTKDTIEELGCTDLRQQWGQIKQKVNDAYAAEPLYKFCHGSQTETKFTKPAEIKQEIFKILCEADIESELSQHTRCYRLSRGITYENFTASRLSKRFSKTLNNSNGKNKTAPAKPITICDLNTMYGFKLDSNICNEISKFLSNNIWETYLNNFNLTINSRQDAIFYNKCVSITVERAKNILFTTVKQNSNVWYEERSRRITGSICYSLYTYMKRWHSKDDWIKKMNSTFSSSFKGNSDTFRGKISEDKAKVVYEKSTGYKVQELGLVILHTSPWLGYSPDGISNQNILLEIKSPKNGKNLDVQNLLKTLPFIQFVDNKPTLKTHHPYYGQVQMGLCLLALEKCHFVVFDSLHNTIATVNVPRNDNFIKDLIFTISKCYFEHVLPWLSARKSACNKENK